MSRRLRSGCAGAEAAHVPSLVDQCYSTLTSGKSDWQQLEELPQSMLMSLLKRCAEERDELKLHCEEQGVKLQQLEAKERARYLVDPPCSCDRLNHLDLSHIRGIASKWRTKAPEDGEEQPWRDYPGVLSYILEDRSFKFVSCRNPRYHDKQRCEIYQVISSALLLYRLCCLFEIDVNTSDDTDRYKCVWTAKLWHVASGCQATFGEHKGAATVWLRCPAQEDTQLTHDFLELMDLICGDCPHTYDYVRAGSVA